MIIFKIPNEISLSIMISNLIKIINDWSHFCSRSHIIIKKNCKQDRNLINTEFNKWDHVLCKWPIDIDIRLLFLFFFFFESTCTLNCINEPHTDYYLLIELHWTGSLLPWHLNGFFYNTTKHVDDYYYFVDGTCFSASCILWSTVNASNQTNWGGKTETSTWLAKKKKQAEHAVRQRI